MSENAPTMAVSLEEPALSNAAPSVETPPPATPQATNPPDLPPADDPDPEGTIAAATGEKFVPLGAVKAERERRKTAETSLSAKDQEIASLRDKAAKFDEAKTYLDQAKPYIEALRQNGLNSIKPNQPPQEPAGPLSEQEAVEYARDFDLYTADGKPDTARAQRIAKRNADLNARQTQQVVAPLVQNEAQRTSTLLYQKYLATPEVNGIKIDAKYLADAWNMVPPEMIAANPDVGAVLFRTALANQMIAGHKPMSVQQPPVVPTEPAGGGAAPPSFGAIDQRFQQASGLTEAKFKEVRDTYKPGAPNSLE